MAFISPFIMANTNGIPRLESTGVTVGTTNVRFSFRNHPFLSAPFSGLILFRLAQPIPSGTTGTLPVVFDTNGATQALTTIAGADVTASDITGTGIYLCYYESGSNTLQILTGVV